MKNFLVQGLIKSKMHPGYMAGYVNTILKSFCNMSQTTKMIEMNIWGSCWGKKGKTGQSVNDIVADVFSNVATDITINLCDQYPGFKADDIRDELIRIGFKNTVIPSMKNKNHSKIVSINMDGIEEFLMIGSSNFSANTYVYNKNKIDQCDVAFIRVNRNTSKLIWAIINDQRETLNENALLVPWATNVFDNNSITEVDEGFPWNQDATSKRVSIFNTPYSGNADLIESAGSSDT
ncbi:hypothetical protein B9J76_16885 [Lacticaseibacillus paracasei]|uniref:hypothetical protein n=1 Tax=Lacticaseibacillus paracasei TaxID=1597 RepID=UPI000343E374|nr:hypothetical protein [Lacticaseibacillus paracasei]EPC25332.1 hypothetical protein Lpp46_2129 [Lacticaseibacillus paracasei subsp. paracasei Lpp46]OSP82845.1 hypothetical protein B9J76_16885 [Lacticaseibacillus paracasei]